MSNYLGPLPKLRFVDNSGNSLNAGKLFIYQAGTTTKATTYTDSAGSTSNSNPIILDSRGECNCWLPSGSFKFVLAPSTDTDPPTSPFWTVDNVSGVNELQAELASTSSGKGAALVSILQPATNAVARNVAVKLAETFSIMDFGAIGDGTTSDSTAWSNMISGVGSSRVRITVPYPSKITSSLTVPSNIELHFINEGKIIGTGSEAVSISGPVTTCLQKIFQSCVVSFQYGTNVYPEWWGAVGNDTTDDASAIQAACDSVGGASVHGNIIFQPKKYVIGTVITISKSYTALIGAGRNKTYLITSGANQSGVTFYGSSGSHIQYPKFQGISITKSTTQTGGVGLSLIYTDYADIEDLQISEHQAGVYMEAATVSALKRVTCTITSGTTDFVGFKINGVDNGLGNESSCFTECDTSVDANYYSSATTKGFYLYHSGASSGKLQDLYFTNCSTAGGTSGVYVDYTNSATYTSCDLTFVNMVVDQFKSTGIYIGNAPEQSAVSIIGGWINPKQGISNTSAIYLDSSYGVSINSTQIYSDNTSSSYSVYGVYSNSSRNIVINACQFQNQTYGIYFTGSQGSPAGQSSIAANRFYCPSSRAGVNHIKLVSYTSNITICGNIFDGTVSGTGSAYYSADSTTQAINLYNNTFGASTNIANSSTSNFDNNYTPFGTYTPTNVGTSNTNITSLTFYSSQWMRVGNVITVSGRVAVSPTTVNASTVFRASLPVTSTFANPHNGGGAAANSATSGSVFALQAGNDQSVNSIKFVGVPTHTASNDYYYTFTYLLL